MNKIAILLIIGIALLSFNISFSWLSEWQYRRPIIINNTQNNNNLTDYQILVINPIYNETGLILSLHFNEGNGAIVYDSSGNNNHGILYNGTSVCSNPPTSGCPAWVDGRFGRAIQLDGINDYIDLGTRDIFRLSSAFTISGWFRFNPGSPGGRGIIKKFVNETDYDYMLYLSSSGYPAIYIKNPTGASFIATYNVDIRDGNWHHIVATFDGRYLRLYVDGVLRATTDTGGTTVRTSNTPLYIGRGWGGYARMTVDEIRIYNRALSAEEIQALYQAKARPDYEDIRFTDLDGITLLNYWRERDGWFWVRVPNIPARSIRIIYLYYGNPNATSLSNGDLVFEFFDDFEGTTLNRSKWIVQHGSPSVSNGILNVTPRAVIRSNISFSPPVRIVGYWNIGVTSTIYWLGVGFFQNPLGSDVRISDTTGSNAYSFNTFNGVSETRTSLPSSDAEVWKRRIIIWESNRAVFIYDNTVRASHTTNIPSGPLHVGFKNHNDGNSGKSILVDYIFVTKYTSPEPTISFGSEEVNIIIQIYIPRNETYYNSNVTFNFTVHGPFSTYNVTAFLNNNVIYRNSSYPRGAITTLSYLLNTGTYNFTVFESRGARASVIFTIKDFDIVSISFNTNTLELAYENYNITFLYNPHLVDSINTSLYFNNVLANNLEDYRYSSFTNNTHITNTISLTIPLNLSSAILVFENTIYYKNGTSYRFNTSSYTQNIEQSVYISRLESNKKDYTETEDVIIYFELYDKFNKTNAIVSISFQNETKTFFEKYFSTTFELLPNNQISETRIFFANVTAYYKSYSKSLSAQNNLTSHMIVLTNCSDLSNVTTLRFNFKDEETDNLLNFVTMYANFDVWFKEKFKRNYGFAFNVNQSARICIYPTFAELITQGMMQYKANGYGDRMYYIFTRINNVTQNVDLYLLSFAYMQPVYIYVVDQAGNKIQDAIVKIQRYYIDKNQYKTVAQVKTDFEGKGTTYLRVNEIYYKFIVEKDFKVLREFPPMIIACHGNCPPYTITLPIQDIRENPFFKYFGKVSYHCTVNNVTEILRCTVTDLTQTMTKAVLIVNRHGPFGGHKICTNECESSACTLICNVPNLNSTLYHFVLVAEFPENLKYVIDNGYIDFRTTALLGDLGVFIALLLTLVLAFIGIWNPVVSIILSVFGIVISFMLGLIPIGFGALTALVISAIVLIYKMHS
jgi:hypothetical protein